MCAWKGKNVSDKNSRKRIAHLDMDAFFASLEQRDNPHLRGKPVIVGGSLEGRGVVSTCSYEARKYGVHSAMPLQEAHRRCPHGIFVQGNAPKYVSASRQLMEILLHFTPRVEPVSIDEAFLDISGTERLFGSEENLARALKQHIRLKLGVTATIGIAPNKIMAKIASELDKPDGLTVVGENEIESKVYPLPVSAMWGVGKRTVAVLNTLGIRTIGDLAGASEITLKKWFGKNGLLLVRMARGEIDSPVRPPSELPDEKSVGHEHTFARDTNDLDRIENELLLLAQLVGRRLRRKNWQGRRITLKYRYENFETHTHQRTLIQPTNLEDVIYEAAKSLFAEKFRPNRHIRLLGISVSQLVRAANGGTAAPELFVEPKFQKRERLVPVLDRLKDTYGEGILWRASSLNLL